MSDTKTPRGPESMEGDGWPRRERELEPPAAEKRPKVKVTGHPKDDLMSVEGGRTLETLDRDGPTTSIAGRDGVIRASKADKLLDEIVRRDARSPVTPSQPSKAGGTPAKGGSGSKQDTSPRGAAGGVRTPGLGAVEVIRPERGGRDTDEADERPKGTDPEVRGTGAATDAASGGAKPGGGVDGTIHIEVEAEVGALLDQWTNQREGGDDRGGRDRGGGDRGGDDKGGDDKGGDDKGGDDRGGDDEGGGDEGGGDEGGDEDRGGAVAASDEGDGLGSDTRAVKLPGRARPGKGGGEGTDDGEGLGADTPAAKLPGRIGPVKGGGEGTDEGEGLGDDTPVAKMPRGVGPVQGGGGDDGEGLGDDTPVAKLPRGIGPVKGGTRVPHRDKP